MECFGEIFEGEVFIDGLDAVLGAEFQHVVDVLDGANEGASHCDLVVHQVLVIDGIREVSVRSAHHYVHSSSFQEPLVELVDLGVLDEQSGDHNVVFSCILAKLFGVS